LLPASITSPNIAVFKLERDKTTEIW
jgi:hypothetical protein